MPLAENEVKAFQKEILSWYKIHKRDLPWRKTRDPYRILVSEIMLQQTQVSRVITKYIAWIERFPTVEDLAKTTVAEVLQFWSGLGYNRRALNLKKTAEIVTSKYHGIFPQDEKNLLQLPGIGEYTARAVLCFAFDKQVAVVDTNVRKIILTQFAFEGNDKHLKLFAENLLPKGKAYDWNQALMDYASHVLKKEKIPISKQSKFIGSHRYYRGKVLKILLQNKRVPVNNLGSLLKKDFNHKDNEWLEKLLQELTDEGFIVLQQGIITLTS